MEYLQPFHTTLMKIIPKTSFISVSTQTLYKTASVDASLALPWGKGVLAKYVSDYSILIECKWEGFKSFRLIRIFNIFIEKFNYGSM